MNPLLSVTELDILKDIQFLKAKREISEKVVRILMETSKGFIDILSENSVNLPSKAFHKSGKISKGENYRGLPYWVLDQPRLFTDVDTFAFRTMVWWGNEISCTLHLGGNSKNVIQNKLYAAKSLLNNHFICVGQSPWEYHFDEENYVNISQISQSEFEHLLTEKEFVKIAYRIPLDDYFMLSDHAPQQLKYLLKILFPNT